MARPGALGQLKSTVRETVVAWGAWPIVPIAIVLLLSVGALQSVLAPREEQVSLGCYSGIFLGALAWALYVATVWGRSRLCSNCHRRFFAYPATTLANVLSGILLLAAGFFVVVNLSGNLSREISGFRIFAIFATLVFLITLAPLVHLLSSRLASARLGRANLRRFRVCRSCGYVEATAATGKLSPLAALQRIDQGRYLGLSLGMVRWRWCRRWPAVVAFGVPLSDDSNHPKAPCGNFSSSARHPGDSS